jgi:hypothetical protein
MSSLMRHIQRGTAALILSSLFLGELAFASEHGTRLVAPGETLSEIALKELGGSVYHRRNGTLRKILALNPWIKNANAIKPGQVLVMPKNFSVAEVKPATSPARELASAKEAVAEAVAEATPAAAVAADDCGKPGDECFTPESYLGASVGTEYFRIDATDRATGGTATILSRMSPSVRAFWKLDWSPEWSSILSMRFRSDRISASDNNSKRIDQGDGKSWGFRAAVERRWNEKARSRAHFGRQEYLFARAANASSIVFDRVGTTFAGLEHEQTLVRVKAASAGLGAAGNLLLPGEGPGFKTETGWNGRAFAFVQHERESFSIRGDLFYELQRQNSSIADQKTTTTGLAIGLFWRLP